MNNAERYGLSAQGLWERHHTGRWRLVRPMNAAELARVRRALEHLPDKSADLLFYLDPSKRVSSRNLHEQYAQRILDEAEGSATATTLQSEQSKHPDAENMGRPSMAPRIDEWQTTAAVRARATAWCGAGVAHAI